MDKSRRGHVSEKTRTSSSIHQSLITIRGLGQTLPKLLLSHARLKLLLSHYHECKTCGNRYPQDNVPEICDTCGYKL